MDDEIQLDMGAAVDSIGSGLGFETSSGGDDGDLSVDLGDTGTGVNTGAAGADPPGADDAGVDGDPAGAAAGKPTNGVTDPAATTLEPPKTWRKEAAATWATLPPEAKAEILKREEDIFKGIEAYKADAGFGKSIKTIMDPYLPIMRQYNIDPAVQVQNLMNAHYTLAMGSAEQKVALFQQLARDYKIDLAGMQFGDEAPYIDPAVKNLQNELQAVKSQLSSAEQARLTETKQALEKQIDAFAQDPANVHFNEVANDMAVLLEKGICKTLPEAYERAIWMNPAVRAKELTRQQAEASKKAADEAAARAAAARKATGANVRTSAKSGSAAAPLGSMDDTLKETLAAIKARG